MILFIYAILKGGLMSIYVTGDKHGTVEIDELLPFYYTVGKYLTPEDHLVIMGDFGLLFDPCLTEREQKWLTWLSSMPWNTLFIDGNHENFTRLDHLPEIERFGNSVGVVSDNIFHLKRGYIYTIEGFRCFCFGGALSLDKNMRRPGISWWEREIPSEEEMARGWQSLDQVQWKVDYVFTHMAPNLVLIELCHKKYIGAKLKLAHVPRDPVAIYLNTIVSRLSFRRWYFGHLHVQTPPFCIDVVPRKCFQALYRLVVPIEEGLTSSGSLPLKEPQEKSLTQILLQSQSLLDVIDNHGDLLNAWLKYGKTLDGRDVMSFQRLIRRATPQNMEIAIENAQKKGYYYLLIALKMEYKEMTC
ncbi:MAG TPA: hypothetical protein DEP01_04935 [Aminobacterium sp.]|uniref:metallophosphoesterase n=2 Tax=Aminobacterium TaxID=81466 RepID=UPI000ECA3491|nr:MULTISPECIES: metallophosphoesterase [unclassified Aminobacterium]HCA40891.1 hypothetical protein [Aminobacterium sp.]